MQTTVSLLIFLVCSSCLAAPAAAQSVGGAVVLPYGTGTSDAVLKAAEDVEAGLTARRAKLISFHDARDRFTTRSRAPLAAGDTDVDVLAREAHMAIEHVAFGRSQAAQRSVREVLTRAERALESLNRQTSTARQVLDACLALVRSALQRNDRREAMALAMGCRRLVPDVGPNENLHPASVIGVLAETDDQLRRMRIGRLSVTSTPQSSCAVYLNGRHLGTTPFALERAAAGSYRVQVECGTARGRVHTVELGEEPVALAVDTDFDTAVQSEPRLQLRYGNHKPDANRLTQHAKLAGKAVRADDVLLVGILGNKVEILRVLVSQARIVGRASVPWVGTQGLDRSQVDAALEALFQGRFQPDAPATIAAGAPPAAGVDASEAVAATASVLVAPAAVPPLTADTARTAPTAPRKDSSPARSARLRQGAGIALAGVGAVGFGVGVYFESRRNSLNKEASGLAIDDPEFDETTESYDSARSLTWLGVGGAALAAGSIPLLVRPRAQVPWWSWTSGAAGLALAGVGIWQITVADDCKLPGEGAECFMERDSAPRGALLLSAGAVALTLPLTHLLRRKDVELSVHAQRGDLSLALRLRR